MAYRKKFRVNGKWVTRDDIAAKLKVKVNTVTKRLADTPQPWTWANLSRERYKPARAKYRIDNKLYDIQQVAKELKISVHAARGRIYERLETHGKLSWAHLRRNMRGSKKLGRLLKYAPASQMIRDQLREQGKTITCLGRALGVTNFEYVRRLTAGERNITPEMAERIAEALMLDSEETNKFLLAGARQAGWKIKGNIDE